MKIMTIALAVLAFLGLVFVVGFNAQTYLHATPPMAAVNGNGQIPEVDLDKIVPDGQELTFDEFRQRAGDDIANMLAQLNMTHIKRNGSQFTITAKPSTVTKNGVTVYISSKVTCEGAILTGNIVTLKKVEGVDVDTGLGRYKLREAVITPGANNTATIDGKLEISRWLPYVSFSVTVDTTPPTTTP